MALEGAQTVSGFFVLLCFVSSFPAPLTPWSLYFHHPAHNIL